MLLKHVRKAQTTAEYAILIGLVVAAVLAMQVYVKRGFQARVKDAVDDMATKTSGIGTTNQYEPYYMTQTANSTQNASDTENLQTGGAIGRTSNAESTVNRSANFGW